MHVYLAYTLSDFRRKNRKKESLKNPTIGILVHGANNNDEGSQRLLSPVVLTLAWIKLSRRRRLQKGTEVGTFLPV